MKKFIYIIPLIIISLFLNNSVFAGYSKDIGKKDWNCHESEITKTYKCSETEFFYNRMFELINRASLNKENKNCGIQYPNAIF